MVARLPAAPPGRLQVRFGAECHWTILLPYVYAGRSANLVQGGASVQSSRNYDYLWELRDADPARVAWIFDAPLLLMRRNQADRVPGGTLLFDGATYQLRQFPSPGLVGPVRVVGELPPGRAESRAAILRWLASAAPMRNEVLAHAGSGNAATAAADTNAATTPPHARTLGLSRGGSTITSQVEVDADANPTTFVIRESWQPRWHATIDGRAARVRRVAPDDMAVDVPSGRHAIVLRFERPGWAWLLWWLWPGLTVVAWARQRRATAPIARGPAWDPSGPRAVDPAAPLA